MQLDMFAAVPAEKPKLAEKQAAPTKPKELDPVDLAIVDIINGWPKIDCSGAHHLLDPLAADWLQRLRGMPPVLRKKNVPYRIIQELRQAGVSSFRYAGASLHVRFKVERILELGAERRRRSLAYHGIDEHGNPHGGFGVASK